MYKLCQNFITHNDKIATVSLFFDVYFYALYITVGWLQKNIKL